MGNELSWRTLLIVFVSAILATASPLSCQSDDGDSSTRYSTTYDDDTDVAGNDDVDDDSLVDDDDADDDVDDDADDDAENEYDDWDDNWECDLWDGCECALYYREFLEKASEYSHSITEEELELQLENVLNGDVPQLQDPSSENELRSNLIELLNIGFLIEEIEDHPLDYQVIEDEYDADYRYRYLELEDPYIGPFQGILLTPNTAGPHPAIVAVHGHSDNANSFMHNYGGMDYPERGYAIFMITVRARCGDRPEHVASRKLLLDGFALIGLRVYKSLLSVNFLRSLDDIDPDAIFLIGHSAGSVDGNITRIIGGEDYFSAYVSDETSQNYCTLGPNDDFRDETAPAISPFSFLVSPAKEYSVPVMQEPYGYPDGIDNVIQFFNSVR